MKKDLKGLAAEFRDYLERETNSPLTIPTRDRHIRKIAAEINSGLRNLRRLRHRYMNGDRELKEAVTNISHDLRTPITAIYGYLDLLEHEEDTETVKFYIGQIQNRTDCLRQLTEELFRYSVIVSSWQGVCEETVLNRILEESLLACYGEFAQKGIEPVIEITEVPVLCRIDRPAFDRIVSNILSNVLKYSDGDLRVGLDADGTIHFTNSAKNLTPVMVERLFDRFYTVETGRNSTGLGLSIARTRAHWWKDRGCLYRWKADNITETSGRESVKHRPSHYGHHPPYAAVCFFPRQAGRPDNGNYLEREYRTKSEKL